MLFWASDDALHLLFGQSAPCSHLGVVMSVLTVF